MSIKTCADIMGMPVSLNIVDASSGPQDAEAVFAYLRHIDCVFSTYKAMSETERINRGELSPMDYSAEMRRVIALCEETKAETGGYFDAWCRGRFDPSGLVKGYAIQHAAELLWQRGFLDFFIEAGGDVQTSGLNNRGEKWRVGIQSPFDPSALVCTVYLSGEGIATSGAYARGAHIYNPIQGEPAHRLASLTVVASNVYEADRFATAAFAMGEPGGAFVQAVPGLEGYVITPDHRAFCTTGFQKYFSR